MIVRRKAIEDIGSMDERFFMYCEDADWCKRMWVAGWKVVYNPCFSFKHFIGGSSSKLIVKLVFSFHRSTYKFYRKYNQKSSFFNECVLSFRFCTILLMYSVKFFSSQKRKHLQRILQTEKCPLNHIRARQ